MDENEIKFIRNGNFSVSPTHKVSGTISLNSDDSVLHLWSDDIFDVVESTGNTITGILDNQEKVSLIECVKTEEYHYRLDKDISQHKKFFPHYVIIGNRYFSHSDKVISHISLVVDDAVTLFLDMDAFGTVILKPDEAESLNRLDIFREIPFSDGSPIIGYYTGKSEIFSANTVIGKISAFNSTKSSFGGTSGVHIENKIYVDINLSEPVSITEVDYRIRKLLRFFEVIVGRPQNLLEVQIVHMDDNPLVRSSVHINMYPNREGNGENRSMDTRDILIDGSREPAKFEELLCAWLERNEMWFTARLRFSEGWTQQGNYDVNRVIRAANMFDLLPEDAFPKDPPLSSELASAVSTSQDFFKKLPKSSERDSILNALGRIKQQSLKQKIRYRTSFLTNLIGNHIPEIEDIIDAAVDLRNLYVHGTKRLPKKKIQRLKYNQVFLTDTLEFVFCTSDLVELGWDIGSWYHQPMLGHHPFCLYVRDYKTNLSKFNSQ